MKAAEIDLRRQQRYAPDLDCVCASSAELVRAVERARARHRDDREVER